MFYRRFLIVLVMALLARVDLLNADDAPKRRPEATTPPAAVPRVSVPTNPVPPFVAQAIAKPPGAKPTEEDFVPDQVITNCLFVEVRGNLKKSLAEAGFREITSGTRFVSPSYDQASDDAEALATMLKAISASAEIEVLSRPHIRGLMGYECYVHVGAPNSISYLVKKDKNSFEVRETTDAQLGLHAWFLFHPGNDPNQILISPLKISSTTLDGREPIPGLDLDVGKPIISSRTLETSITLNEGKSVNAIALPSPPGRQLVLFLNARRIRSNNDETLPNPPIDIPGAVQIKISPQAEPTPQLLKP